MKPGRVARGYRVRVTAMDILNVSDHIQVSSSGTCCNWMKQGGTARNCDAVEVPSTNADLVSHPRHNVGSHYATSRG